VCPVATHVSPCVVSRSSPCLWFCVRRVGWRRIAKAVRLVQHVHVSEPRVLVLVGGVEAAAHTYMAQVTLCYGEAAAVQVVGSLQSGCLGAAGRAAADGDRARAEAEQVLFLAVSRGSSTNIHSSQEGGLGLPGRYLLPQGDGWMARAQHGCCCATLEHAEPTGGA